MAFEPGKSGNPAGRPKQADLEAVDLSILRALRKVIRRNPRLIEEAIQRRLEARDNFGMIELIGKLTKELGTKDEAPSQIAIIFNSNLNTSALKEANVRVIDAQAVRELPDPVSTETQGRQILFAEVQEPELAQNTQRTEVDGTSEETASDLS